MANTRMTKVEKFNAIATAVKGMEFEFDVQEFLTHEVELLQKKSSKSGQTKTQKENEGILVTITECLGRNTTPMTITELQSEYTELAGFSNQKLSALMKKLVDKGTVTKTVDKKKSYFSLATDEVEG